MKNINSNLGLALLNAARTSAETAEAEAARLYTDEQLDAAFTAMREGTHQYYPAAAHFLEIATASWAEYSRLLVAYRGAERDRRSGQLHLAI